MSAQRDDRGRLLMRMCLQIVLACFVTSLTASGQVNRGYTGTQVFGNCGHPDPKLALCGLPANAGAFLLYVPPEAGILHLNTDGSDFDTLMGVYLRSPVNPAVLQLVACDNNSGIDGEDSALVVPVRAGETNIILLAGVEPQCGYITFEYNLVSPSRLTALPRTPSGQFQGRVTGHDAMRFTIQTSSNLKNWTPLLTTNATNASLDFVDPSLPVPPKRFYRALMLPPQ